MREEMGVRGLRLEEREKYEINRRKMSKPVDKGNVELMGSSRITRLG